MDSRDNLLLIFRSGLTAVAPDTALLSHLQIDGSRLVAGSKTFHIPSEGLHVVGAGKGAAPMALTFENLLGNRIKEGFVVVKYGHELDLEHIEIAQAAHPVPDAAGEKSALRCLEIAGHCRTGDLLVCLITGGASALLPAPVEGISLVDLQNTTSVLLKCGAEIGEINTIRRHLSRIGGGKLALAANGAQVLSLIISDVVGDKLNDIASGPTVYDPTSFADCLSIIKKYDIAAKLPAQVVKYLQDEAQLEKDQPSFKSAFANVENVIIASNGQALDAAAKKAADLGYEVVKKDAPITGESRDVAVQLISEAKMLQKKGGKICLLAGGETTVTIHGKGKGGRNQEMALAAALELENNSGISALFGGTDGTDGPVDAAGGFAFATTVAGIGGRPKAEAFLANNDSNTALQLAGDLLVTGPTRTNVMDLAIILIDHS